nr:hypothetical protein [Polynucleobacter sp.]
MIWIHVHCRTLLTLIVLKFDEVARNLECRHHACTLYAAIATANSQLNLFID